MAYNDITCKYFESLYLIMTARQLVFMQIINVISHHSAIHCNTDLALLSVLLVSIALNLNSDQVIICNAIIPIFSFSQVPDMGELLEYFERRSRVLDNEAVPGLEPSTLQFLSLIRFNGAPILPPVVRLCPDTRKWGLGSSLYDAYILIYVLDYADTI